MQKHHIIMLFSLLVPAFLFAKPLNIGDTAPRLTVKLDDGSLADLAIPFQKGPTLVYFYPKSFTGGCTKQACNLRDHFENLQTAQIIVFGVSADTVKTQADFKKEHNLPFHLVADTNLELTKAFGVPTFIKGFPKRQSFLIKDGKVIWRDLKAKPMTQAQDAIKAYERMK